MNSYELTVILRAKDAENLQQKLKDILAKNKVEIAEEASWGLKKLAYMIDNETEGFYFFANVTADPTSVEKVNAEFKLNRDFLRHLFVKTKASKSA